MKFLMCIIFTIMNLKEHFMTNSAKNVYCTFKKKVIRVFKITQLRNLQEDKILEIN